MAIGHLSTKVVQRSAGQTAVHAAAYAARARMVDERTGTVYDYSRKNADVMFSFVGLPKGAPDHLRDPAAFANALEKRERRVNSQVARKFIMALPSELTAEQREFLVKDFGRENFARKGLAYHVAIHLPHEHGDHRNFHAHWTVSTRVMEKGVFTEKDRDSNSKAALLTWRDNWEKLVNRHLERHGHTSRISMKTLEAQGIDRTPQIHLGQGASALERKGKATSRGDVLRDIANDNAPEPEEEPEYFDRDQQDAAWHEAVIEGAIKADVNRQADERLEREAERARRASAREADWVLRRVERIETRLGMPRAAQQNRHLEERGVFGAKAHRETGDLQQSQQEHYGAYAETLTERVALLSQHKSRFPRLWARLTGKAKSEAEQRTAALRSLENLEMRRAEQRQGLAQEQQAAEQAMLRKQDAEVTQLEAQPDRQRMDAFHRALINRAEQKEAQQEREQEGPELGL